MSNRPVALEAYETLADAYAAGIPTKPHNAYYERPATQSLLPDVSGLRVLDAGCGPGVYSEWLLDRGASVVSFDVSPRMVELASARVGDRAEIFLADLSKPLDGVADQSFDLVISTLVLDYIEDWRAPLGELLRVLKPGGMLVASVAHPFCDYLYFRTDRYFETERVSAVWRGFGRPVEVPSFRRSLEEVLNPFREAGFRIDRLLEPRPTEEFRRSDPRHYEALSRLPCFLCIRALRDETRHP